MTVDIAMLSEAQREAAVKLALATGRLIVATDGISALQEQRIEALEAMEAFASLPPSAPVDRDAAIEFAMRYGPKCRDCGDENGVCPASGLPCGDSRKGISHVVDALLYGAKHGYIATPSVLAESTSNDCLLVAEAVRERCAGVTDDIAARYDYSTHPGSGQRQYAAKEIASTIRGIDLSGVGVG